MYDDKEYHRRYYQANKERIKATSKARRESHKEELSAYGKQWRKDHPDYYKLYTMGELVGAKS